MFNERKTVYFRLLFCITNEQKIKSIVNKLEEFTNNNFPLKDRIKHKANIVYKGTCSRKESYIRETKHNAKIR